MTSSVTCSRYAKGKSNIIWLEERSYQCMQFFEREKEREFKYMLGKCEGADSGCTQCASQ